MIILSLLAIFGIAVAVILASLGAGLIAMFADVIVAVLVIVVVIKIIKKLKKKKG